jgi:DMSO/TMAO reductase YedYZ molybdopterin-dependent catalytic subunit
MGEYAKKILEIKDAAVRRGRERGEAGSKAPQEQRLPPGQYQTKKFPVLDLGIRKPLALEDWTFEVTGLVEQAGVITWDEFTKLPRVEQVSDFHCVTRWSVYDLQWAGVRFVDLAAVVKPLPEARFVVQYARDGYSTNLPLEVLMDDDVLIAYELGGEPISLEHGGPVRCIVPKRYAWKGAKFLSGLEFVAKDKPGFWEVRGYHNEGDPWKEERFW